MIKIMRNLESDKSKQIKVGFSWTTFFFGWIPSVIRGDFVSALKLFFLNLVTFRIYGAWKAFNVNQDYENFLISKGYREVEIINSNSLNMPIIEYFAVALTTVAPIITVILIVGLEINVLDPILNSGLLSKIPVIKEFVIEDDLTSKKDSIVSSSQKEENENIKDEDKFISDSSIKSDSVLDSSNEDIEKEDIESDNIKKDSISDFDNEDGSSISKKELTKEEGIKLFNDFLASNIVDENHASFNKNRAKEEFEKELKEIKNLTNIAVTGLQLNYSDRRFSEFSAKVFEMYDKELNYIWEYLKETLPKETIDLLTKEQIEWINYKEEVKRSNMEMAKSEEDPKIREELIDGLLIADFDEDRLTEERCYYLLQYVN